MDIHDFGLKLLRTPQFIPFPKRNLRGDVQRSGGTPVGGHSRLFEGTPLNMLTDFTNNDFCCRAIDFKKLPLCN